MTDITIHRTTSILGPNIWSARPVTSVEVELTYVDTPDRIDVGGVAAELRRALDALPDPEARVMPPLDLIPLPADGNLPEIIGVVAVNLQRLAGLPVSFSCSTSRPGQGTHVVTFEHFHEQIGLLAATTSLRLVRLVMSGGEPEFDPVADFRTRFMIMTGIHWRPTATQPIIDEAKRRGIPVAQLDPRHRLTELGNGAYRRRIAGSATSLLPVFGDEISQDKALTRHYLRSAGLPIADGEVVRRESEAVAAAERIGYPVAIKPVDSAAGRGVLLDLRNADEVRNAFPLAAAGARGDLVLVEAMVRGKNYRVAIVGGRLVSLIEEHVAQVVGDDRHTIQQLIEIAGTDPRRGVRLNSLLARIVVDDETLAMLERQDMSLTSIPASGEVVKLGPRPVVARGGISINRTGETHPANWAILEQAIAVLGLDVGTIDLIAEDIARSIWETSGAILEINTYSAFRPQMFPGEGKPFDPGSPIVDMLFPPGQPVRAPLVAIAGCGPECTIGEEIAAILRAAGKSPGLASRKGVFINGTRYGDLEGRNPHGPRTVLNNPQTEVAVIEIEFQEIIDHGLGFDYCDVLVLAGRYDGPPAGLRSPEEVLIETVGSIGQIVIAGDRPDLAETFPDRTFEVVLDRQQLPNLAAQKLLLAV